MSETCLSLYFKLLLLVVSIFVFGVVGVLSLVVFWFLSVSVVHSYSCVTGIFSGRFRFALPNNSSFTRGGFVCGRAFCFILLVQLQVYIHHGVDFVGLFFVLNHCLSQRRVGVGYALRVSPAVTRLTVYRRPQVLGACPNSFRPETKL